MNNIILYNDFPYIILRNFRTHFSITGYVSYYEALSPHSSGLSIVIQIIEEPYTASIIGPSFPSEKYYDKIYKLYGKNKNPKPNKFFR